MELLNNDYELNDKSKRTLQPDNLNIPLKDHQLAMLFKCLQIEKNSVSPYCILGDKAGSGKTAVMISLILCDKIINKKTKNLIIVPQNIHSQWLGEFNKFCKKDFLSIKEFINYSDITGLFFDDSVIEDNDVIITTSMYYNLVMGIINQKKIVIKRIIFDEIDNISNVIDNGNFKSKIKNTIMFPESDKSDKNVPQQHLWFISASYENCITKKGFEFKDEIIPHNELKNIICKCCDSFINKNLGIFSQTVKNIHCDDISDIFSDCLSVEQFDNINSLNFKKGFSRISNEVPLNSKDLLKLGLKDYLFKYDKHQEIINSIKNSLKIKDENLKEKMINEEESGKKFIEKIIHEYYKCVETLLEELTIYEKINKIIKFIDSYETKNLKIEKIKDIAIKITKKDKILLFSDFTGSFEIINLIFKKYNIKCEELNGGSIKNTDSIINNYKNKDTTVLLMNSSYEGCGLNLENTTHILFLHKTSEILYNQVIGRALRIGRKTNLTITTLLNKNEIVIV